MDEKVVWQPKPRKKYERKSLKESDKVSNVESKQVASSISNIESDLKKEFEEGAISLTNKELLKIFIRQMIIDEHLAVNFSAKDLATANLILRFGDNGVQVVIESYQTESVFIFFEDIFADMASKIIHLTERVNNIQSIIRDVLFK